MKQATESHLDTASPTDEHTHQLELEPNPESQHKEETLLSARIAVKPRLLISALLLAIAAIGGGVYWSHLSAQQVEKKATDAKAAAIPEAAIPPDVVVAEEKELKQITVEPVVEKTIAVEQETTGKVAFNEDRMTPVFAPYAGRVIEVLANKGAVVRAGQPLLLVESPDFVTAQNELSAAHAEVDKSKIAVDAAQKVVDRLRLLHQREAIATKDLQVAEVDLARAREELSRDEAAVAVAKNKLALFGKDAAEIDEIEKHLTEKLDRRIVIRAPISGTIVERKVGPGEFVKPAMPEALFLLSDLST
ncbi:MAG TPA: efflux RND transporter periplasmic adaptor subunit, partial [Blastocatellia bacterium]|nr:efflux RND transporter periplasmic adaptor subunit [Blastocatellia bacterium]